MFWTTPNSEDTTRIRPSARFVSVLQSLVLPAAVLIAVAMVGCDTTGMQQREDDQTVSVQTRPSDQLRELTSEDPSDFAWDVFAEEIVIQWPDSLRAEAYPDQVEMELRTVRAVGSESGEPDIVGTTSTEPVTVSGDRLADGVMAADLLSASGLRPLIPEEQFPSDAFFPVPSNQFVTGIPVDTRKAPGGVPLYVINQILEGRDLGPDQAIVVVYAAAPGGVPLYDRATPFGLLLQREAQ